MRVLTQEDARRIETAIHALARSVPGTELKISGHIGRPPMEHTPGNRQLWEVVREVAGQIGHSIAEGTAGGGSDGNTTNLFAPTLDGLGAVGDVAHAAHEHVQIESLPERAALLAGLLALPSLREQPNTSASIPQLRR